MFCTYVIDFETALKIRISNICLHKGKRRNYERYIKECLFQEFCIVDVLVASRSMILCFQTHFLEWLYHSYKLQSTEYLHLINIRTKKTQWVLRNASEESAVLRPDSHLNKIRIARPELSVIRPNKWAIFGKLQYWKLFIAVLGLSLKSSSCLSAEFVASNPIKNRKRPSLKKGH